MHARRNSQTLPRQLENMSRSAPLFNLTGRPATHSRGAAHTERDSTSVKYLADKTITVSHMCCAYLSAIPEPSEGPFKVKIFITHAISSVSPKIPEGCEICRIAGAFNKQNYWNC